MAPKPNCERMCTSSSTTARKATGRQLGMQLKATLEELQASKAFCEQLLQERNDNEAELQKILDKNTVLRNELVENDFKLSDATGELLRLQNLVDSFNQCASTHEVALKRITHLEEELGAANDELNYFRKERECYDASITQNLYQEIVGNENTKDGKKYIFFNSSAKLKKYVKINRYIRRTQKLVKSQPIHKKYLSMKLELSVMKERVKHCDIELGNYDLHTQNLNAELGRLKDKLEATSSLYLATQKEVREHVSAFSQLLEECKHNEERYNSLINSNFCACGYTPQPAPTADVRLGVPLGSVESSPPVLDTHSPNHVSYPKTIIYSDQIGSGMGSMLGNKIHQNVTNFCYPNISINQLCDLLSKESFDNRTTLVIMIGSSYSVDKSGVDKLISTINIIEESGIHKIILCALPYFQKPSYYNNRIAYLNSLMYNAICFNGKIHFFDLNKFIKRFMLTSEGVFLSRKYFLTLVDLLAFNIEPNTCSGIDRPQHDHSGIRPLPHLN